MKKLLLFVCLPVFAQVDNTLGVPGGLLQPAVQCVGNLPLTLSSNATLASPGCTIKTTTNPYTYAQETVELLVSGYGAVSSVSPSFVADGSAVNTSVGLHAQIFYAHLPVGTKTLVLSGSGAVQVTFLENTGLVSPIDNGEMNNDNGATSKPCGTGCFQPAENDGNPNDFKEDVGRDNGTSGSRIDEVLATSNTSVTYCDSGWQGYGALVNGGLSALYDNELNGNYADQPNVCYTGSSAEYAAVSSAWIDNQVGSVSVPNGTVGVPVTVTVNFNWPERTGEAMGCDSDVPPCGFNLINLGFGGANSLGIVLPHQSGANPGILMPVGSSSYSFQVTATSSGMSKITATYSGKTVSGSFTIN